MPKKALISLFFLVCLGLILSSVKADVETYQIEISNIKGLSNRNPAKVTVWDSSTDNITELIVYAYLEYASDYSQRYNITVYNADTLEYLWSADVSYSANIARYKVYFAIVEYAKPESYLDGFWVVTWVTWKWDDKFKVTIRAIFCNHTSQTVTKIGESSYQWYDSGYTTQYHQGSGCFSNTVYISNTHYIACVGILEECTSGGETYKRSLVIGVVGLTTNTASFIFGKTDYCADSYEKLYGCFMMYLPSNNYYLGLGVIQDMKITAFCIDRNDGSIKDVYAKGFTELKNLVKRYSKVSVGGRYAFSPLVKVRHIQTSTGNPNIVTGAVPFASMELGKSALMWVDLKIKYNTGDIDDISISPIYYVSPMVSQCDLYGSQVSATYWYNPATDNIFVANYQAGEVVTQVIDIGDVEADENTYIFGLRSLFKLGTNKVIIYALSEPIEEPEYITPPATPTTPESPTWGTDWTLTAVGLAIPFMFMFVPAILLGEKAGVIGLIVGLCLSITIMYLIGLLPLWAVFLAGLGIVALIFFGRERIIGGSI